MPDVDLQGTDDAAELRLELHRNDEAPQAARAAVREFCRRREVGEDNLASILLLVSEVVTNAVLHPPPDVSSIIRLSGCADQAIVRIDVTDQGTGFVPKVRDPAQVGRGYGLFLLDRIATEWGVSVEGGTTVWFELAIGPEEPPQN